MVRRLVADGVEVHAVVPAPEQGLEDFFLELTRDDAGGPARAEAPRRPAPLSSREGRVERDDARRGRLRRDGAHGSTQRTHARRAWGPLRREITKLLFQRRSYLIWGGAALIPFIIALAIELAHSGPRAGRRAAVPLARPRQRDVRAARRAVALLPFLLPWRRPWSPSYMLAGEAELGTLRIVLLRPVKRGSICSVSGSRRCSTCSSGSSSWSRAACSSAACSSA